MIYKTIPIVERADGSLQIDSRNINLRQGDYNFKLQYSTYNDYSEYSPAVNVQVAFRRKDGQQTGWLSMTHIREKEYSINLKNSWFTKEAGILYMTFRVFQTNESNVQLIINTASASLPIIPIAQWNPEEPDLSPTEFEIYRLQTNEVIEGLRNEISESEENLKVYIDGKIEEAEGLILIDNKLSDTSENPVQNKVITLALDDKGASISASINPTNYIMTLSLLSSKGVVLSSQEIDLPLETMIVGGRVSGNNLILTLKNGNTITIPLDTLLQNIDTGFVEDIDINLGFGVRYLDTLTNNEILNNIKEVIENKVWTTAGKYLVNFKYTTTEPVVGDPTVTVGSYIGSLEYGENTVFSVDIQEYKYVFEYGLSGLRAHYIKIEPEENGVIQLAEETFNKVENKLKIDFSPTIINGVYCEVNDGVITLNGTCTSDYLAISIPYIPLNGVYSLSNLSDNYNLTIGLVEGFSVLISTGQTPATISTGIDKIWFYNTRNVSFDNVKIKLMLVEGKVASQVFYPHGGTIEISNSPNQKILNNEAEEVKRVIDLSTSVEGYLDGGGQVISTTTTSRVTDYIEVDSSKAFVSINFSFTDSNSRSTCFYDSDKNIISYTNISSLSSRVVIPNGTKYMRITYYKYSSVWITYRGNIAHLYDIDPITLWNNATPDANFAGQSVTLSQGFEKFNYLIIYYKNQALWSDGSQCVIIPKTYWSNNYQLMNVVNTNVLSRVFSITSADNDVRNTVTFNDCKSTSGTVSNGFLIPVSIKGVNYL